MDFEEVVIDEEDENVKLRRRLLALQTVRNDFHRKDQTIATLKKKIVALENEKFLLEQKNSEIEPLRSQVTVLERSVSDRSAILQEVQTLNVEIVKNKEEISRLESIIVELKLKESHSTRTLKSRDEMVKQMTGEHKDYQSALISEISSLKGLIAQLKTDLQAKEKKLTASTTSVSVLEERVAQFKTMIKESKDQRLAAIAQAAENLAEANRWKAMYGELEATMRDSREEHSAVVEETTKITTKLHSKMKQLEGIEKTSRKTHQSLVAMLSSLCVDIAPIINVGVSQFTDVSVDNTNVSNAATTPSRKYNFEQILMLLQQRIRDNASIAASPLGPQSPSGSDPFSPSRAGEHSEVQSIIKGFCTLLESNIASNKRVQSLSEDLVASGSAIEDAQALLKRMEARMKLSTLDLEISDIITENLNASIAGTLTAHGVDPAVSNSNINDTLLKLPLRIKHDPESSEIVSKMWQSVSSAARMSHPPRRNVVDSTMQSETQNIPTMQPHDSDFEASVSRQQKLLLVQNGVKSLIDLAVAMKQTIDKLTQTERENAARRRVWDQASASEKTELEQQLMNCKASYEKLIRQKEDDFSSQLAELTSLNAEGERAWSLRESEMRHTFTSKYQELEQTYARKLRNFDTEMQDAEGEKEDLRNELHQLNLSLSHLLWHSLYQSQQLIELRQQKKLCFHVLQHDQELFDSLAKLADGCIRVVDNSEVLVTFSTGEYTNSEYHGTLPVNISERQRTKRSHRRGRRGDRPVSFRAAVVAVLMALRFKKIMWYLRRLDPAEIGVFETVGTVRFNLSSLPAILDKWYPPTIAELAHSMPSQGAALLLGAAADTLTIAAANNSQSPRAKLSLLEYLTKKPFRSTMKVPPSGATSKTIHETNIDTLRKTLTSMSTAIRDMREREISYKVRLQQQSEQAHKHEVIESEMRHILSRQANTLAQVELDRTRILQEGPYTRAAKSQVYAIHNLDSDDSSMHSLNSRSSCNMRVDRFPGNSSLTGSMGSLDPRTIGLKKKFSENSHDLNGTNHKFQSTMTTSSSNSTIRQGNGFAGTTQSSAAMSQSTVNDRVEVSVSMPSTPASSIHDSKTGLSHPPTPLTADTRNDSRRDETLDDSQMESLDRHIEQLYSEIGKLSDRVLTPHRNSSAASVAENKSAGDSNQLQSKSVSATSGQFHTVPVQLPFPRNEFSYLRK